MEFGGVCEAVTKSHLGVFSQRYLSQTLNMMTWALAVTRPESSLDMLLPQMKCSSSVSLEQGSLGKLNGDTAWFARPMS